MFIARLRDPGNTWKAELAEGKAPRKVEGATLALPDGVKAGARATVRTYDPWSNAWNPATVRENTVAQPVFSRSIVVRIDRGR